MNRTHPILLVRIISVTILLVAVLGVVLEQVFFSREQGTGITPAPVPTTTRHHKKTPTPIANLTPVATGMPYVLGTQIIDGSGHPLILHGAQIESSFTYIKPWEAGQEPTRF